MSADAFDPFRDLDPVVESSGPVRLAAAAAAAFRAATAQSRALAVAARIARAWADLSVTQRFRLAGIWLTAAGATHLVLSAFVPQQAAPALPCAAGAAALVMGIALMLIADRRHQPDGDDRRA